MKTAWVIRSGRDALCRFPAIDGLLFVDGGATASPAGAPIYR
jgi:hypothetical protein